MRKRTCHIDIRVTPEEKAKFEKNANICGLPISSYFRMLANGYKPKSALPLEYSTHIKELSELHDVFLQRDDPDSAKQILTLVKQLTTAILPDIGDRNGNDKNMGSS